MVNRHFDINGQLNRNYYCGKIYNIQRDLLCFKSHVLFQICILSPPSGVFFSVRITVIHSTNNKIFQKKVPIYSHPIGFETGYNM